MSDQAVIALVAVGAVILTLLVIAAVVVRRRRRLKERFGPEYDRIEADRGWRAAGAELRDRERRYEKLDIHPLEPAMRDEYARRWARVQVLFVDDPPAAVSEAGRLLTTVMSDRGYPVDDDYDQRLADLSVEHGRTLDRYRGANEISRRAGSGGASTEDLRHAMVDYRALFEELLDGGPTHGDTARAVTARTDTAHTDTARPDVADEDRSIEPDDETTTDPDIRRRTL